MKIGVIGDDFTGSGDIANVLARAGARTIQYTGIPAGSVRDCDAAIIALKIRSATSGMAVDQALAACRWLVKSGAEQIVFKVCSTFDSTPQGNIGPVAEALRTELNAGPVLVCPALPVNGRTVYQGHLFVYDRLLNESGMARHPLTPMSDPDIRRWLQRQTSLKVGHLSLGAIVRPGALAEVAAQGAQFIVADALTDADLRALAEQARGSRLVVGGSGIAIGLPGNFGIRAASAPQSAFKGAKGPTLLMSGSCSTVTRGQIAAWTPTHPHLRLAPEHALNPEETIRQAFAFVERHRDAAPLIYSSADPAEVAEAQAQYGAGILAEGFDSIFAGLARLAVEHGITRLIVAGGETSGAVATELGPLAFRVGPEIAPGVPILWHDGKPPVALALKSGNFGDPDFFAQALTLFGGTS